MIYAACISSYGAQADLAGDICGSLMQDALGQLHKNEEWCALTCQSECVSLQQLQVARDLLQEVVEGESAVFLCIPLPWLL